MNGINRLYQLKKECARVDVEMASERGRFERLRGEDQKPRTVVAFNLFQTPEPIADRMTALLLERNPSRILEPSAGLGRLYKAVRRAGCECNMVLNEIHAECARELYGMSEGDNVTLYQKDFLGLDNVGTFDGVIMNPPFKNALDVKHIKHALTMVNAGGRLVSLCYNGPRQRKYLRPLCTVWEQLPAGSFKKEGTRADVVLMVIDK